MGGARIEEKHPRFGPGRPAHRKPPISRLPRRLPLSETRGPVSTRGKKVERPRGLTRPNPTASRRPYEHLPKGDPRAARRASAVHIGVQPAGARPGNEVF